MVMEEEEIVGDALVRAIGELYENRQKYIDTMSKSEQSDSVAVIVDLIEKNRKQ